MLSGNSEKLDRFCLVGTALDSLHSTCIGGLGMKGTVGRSWRVAILLAVSILPCVGSRALYANLLVNPGFENGDFAGWIVDGSNTPTSGVATDGVLVAGDGFGQGVTNVRSGSYAAYAQAQGDVSPVERLILTQTVSVPMNQDMEVGFFVGHALAGSQQFPLGSNIADEKTQIFIDGLGLLSDPGPSIPGGTEPTDFVELDGVFNTGSRTSIEVAFAIDGSGSLPAIVSFDDFYLRAVPAPSSFVLMGIGAPALIAVARRRRKPA